MATAIEFENISKQYRLGLVSTGTLSHDLNRFWQTKILRREDPYLKVGETNDRASKGSSDYVWALKDINFKVEQGDVVGIIGRNGAGKSTLLKLLSRVTAPTTGIIRAKGRIASLLEVGTGFHPEMTGRENIYMNGAIMGMTRAEISRKLDEIVDFSGCERYLDTPVKRYSSGMTVRLGFAIAAHLEPEILVVDEVLAVGDAEFQKKAIGKMQDVSKGEGRTVLFVSHNMAAVKNLCKNGILLEYGKIKQTGSIDNVVDSYLQNATTATHWNTQNISFSGNGILKVRSFSLKSPNGFITNNDPIHLHISIDNPKKIKGALEVAGKIESADKTYIHYFSSKLKNKTFHLDGSEHISIECSFRKLPLNAGIYSIGIELKFNEDVVYWAENAGSFQMQNSDFYNSGFIWNKGLFLIDQEWKRI
ncbi:MAG: ABC transporter ATP-binding protein [Fibrobacter sp.]|nr:ABC transporter ATP-binding protein [Fibrobacter sp.]